MRFTKTELVDELDLPSSAIQDDIIDQTRWNTIHEIVFKKGDKFYQTTYSAGSTEEQYESPWEYEDEVDCDEVHQVEKIMKVWEKC